jgi:hypothetical protein
MNQTATLTVPEIRDEVHKVASLVDTARRLLTEGSNVDLSALEGKVRVVCEAIHQASGEDLTDLKESMATIIDGLDSLESALNEQFGSILAANEGTTRMAAMNAYRKGR